MPCYRITYHHSAMAPDYIGAAIKYAHTEAEALQCLATKSGRYCKKTNTVVDKNRNTLTILTINEDKD